MKKSTFIINYNANYILYFALPNIIKHNIQFSDKIRISWMIILWITKRVNKLFITLWPILDLPVAPPGGIKVSPSKERDYNNFLFEFRKINDGRRVNDMSKTNKPRSIRSVSRTTHYRSYKSIKNLLSRAHNEIIRGYDS